ncbi:MAG: septum formation family protein [Actinobacteria bacterium]|nr:septum formation family protein [Actinomycetota bacterium]
MTTSRPAVWLLLGAASLMLAGCSAFGGAATPSPTPTGPPEVDVLDLAVGDCLDTHGKPGITRTVPVVDCALEHDSEAYAQVVLDDADFPGDDAVKTRAQTDCPEEFAAFAGIEYDASSLDYAYYFPTSGSWADGDRRILCLIFDPAGRVTGSLEGSAR